MCVFFGEDECAPEPDFEGADVWEDDVLVGFGVDVLVLCDFEGDEVGGDHVADDIELRQSVRHHFADWIRGAVRLRKVSWYFDSSWCVHQLCVSQERQYSTKTAFSSTLGLLAMERFYFDYTLNSYS